MGAAGVLSPAHPLPTGPRGRGTRGKLQVQSSEVALLSPWVPLSVYREHVIGGATAWLLLSASVQSLPAACPVLFCTFLRGFLPLLLQHESVAVAFLVCSIVPVPNLVSVLNIFFFTFCGHPAVPWPRLEVGGFHMSQVCPSPTCHFVLCGA